jgi:hypothetical protein
VAKYAVIRGNAPEGDMKRIISTVELHDPESYNPGRMRYLMLYADAVAAGYTDIERTDPEEYKIELAEQLKNAIAANRNYIAKDPATVTLEEVAVQVRRLTGAQNRLIRFALADFNPNEPV